MAIRAGDLLMVDTNVLLSATNSAREDHEASLKLFELAVTTGIHLATCGQILREYLVVATRSRESNGLGLDLTPAIENLEWFRKRQVFLEETETTHRELVKLIRSSRITGKRIHDANLVSVMKCSGIKTIVTNNADDFTPFTFIIPIQPETLEHLIG